MTDFLRIMTPMLLWLALFSGVYGLHGIGCGLGWTEVDFGVLTLHRTALLSAWGAAGLLQALLLAALARPLRSPRPFVQGVSLKLSVAGLFATAWSLFPLVFATSCG